MTGSDWMDAMAFLVTRRGIDKRTQDVAATWLADFYVRTGNEHNDHKQIPPDEVELIRGALRLLADSVDIAAQLKTPSPRPKGRQRRAITHG